MTLTVKQMTSIWREVLAPAHVVPHSDFFSCGGTSLNAAQIAARIAAESGQRVRVRTVMESPTPERLTSALSGVDAVSESRSRELAAHDEPPSGDVVALSSQQAAIWFAESLNPSGRGYNCVTTVRIPETLDVPRLRAALAGVIERNEALRTSFPAREGMPVQVVADTAVPELRIHGPITPGDLRDEVRRLSETSFDVASLPLIFWILYEEEGTRDTVLAQVEHHFVHDGWSTWLILHQIADAYRGVALHPAGDVPSYRDFARGQTRWLEGPEAERQRDFWVRHLSGGHDETRFSRDAERPAVFSHRGTTVAVELEKEVASRVSAAVRELGATPFSVLYSAFGILIGSETGAEKPVLGTGYRNRAPEFQQTVGMFVNTLGIRFPAWRDLTFGEVVREASSALLDGHDHQEIPLSAIVRRLQLRPQPTRNPLFQVCISMNDQPDQRLDFGHCVTYDVDFTAGGAKFDLDVVVVPPNERCTWRLLWRYYAEVLSIEEVDMLIRRYSAVLRRCLDEPGAPVGELVPGVPGVTNSP